MVLDARYSSLSNYNYNYYYYIIFHHMYMYMYLASHPVLSCPFLFFVSCFLSLLRTTHKNSRLG